MGYRITFFINTSELIKKSPILGVGTGDFPAEYKKINNIRSQDYVRSNCSASQYVFVGISTAGDTWAGKSCLDILSSI